MEPMFFGIWARYLPLAFFALASIVSLVIIHRAMTIEEAVHAFRATAPPRTRTGLTVLVIAGTAVAVYLLSR